MVDVDGQAHGCCHCGNVREGGETLFLERFRELFVNRVDCYAKQLASRGYTRVQEPLTDEVLRLHLAGEITVGAYQLNKASCVKYLCFDLDPDPEKLGDPKAAARKIIETCSERPDGKHPRIPERALLLEASRYPNPSYHVWAFFEPPVPARVVRWLGHRILDLAGLRPEQIEVFPKQDGLSESTPFGNLVKLPLGFHRVERKWSRFLGFETFKPLPKTVIHEVEGLSLPEAEVERILRLKEGRKGTRIRFVLPKDFKPLPDGEEERIARFLAKYWIQGFRNDLEISFLGWAIKRGIAQESAHRIIKQVCVVTGTDEEDERIALEKVAYHYEKRRSLGSKLRGISGLEGVIRGVLKLGKRTGA